MRTDGELLDDWRAGDREAGDSLLKRHFDTLYRFFATKAPGEHVKDLVQSTLLGAVEGRDTLRGDARPYLLGIARKQLYRFWRDRARDGHVDFSESSVHDLAPSPSDLVARRGSGRVLIQAMRRIALDLQTVLELYYWEELSAAQIAQVLEIPEGTVRSRLRRALEALERVVPTIKDTEALLRSTIDELERWGQRLGDGAVSEGA